MLEARGEKKNQKLRSLWIPKKEKKEYYCRLSGRKIINLFILLHNQGKALQVCLLSVHESFRPSLNWKWVFNVSEFMYFINAIESHRCNHLLIPN